MDTTVISTTNPTTGTITTITTIHQHHFHYWWFILGIVAFALICSGLRAIFWSKDST